MYSSVYFQPGQCGSYPNTTTDPGHHAWYVKTYCTHNALGKFTLYFPYILLISALVLVGIERLFTKVFKSNVQVEGFYSLLLTSKKEKELTVRMKIKSCKSTTEYSEPKTVYYVRVLLEMT